MAARVRPKNQTAGNKLRWEEFSVGSGGSICLVDWMGEDYSIVEAARVSYGEGTRHISNDRTLIRYLMRHWHSTPFEMAELKFRVRVPMDTWRQWIRHRTASVNEYCLVPGTRVLKADLTWENIENLHEGVELVGFGEGPPIIRKNSIDRCSVLKKTELSAPCVRITTEHGTVVSSEDHRWCVRSRKGKPFEWVHAKDMVAGQHMAFTTHPWKAGDSYAAGWMAGFLDGEGWLSVDTNRSMHLGMAQKPGKVLEAASAFLDDNGIPFISYDNSGCKTLAVSRRWEAIRLLGLCRPERLLDKFYDALGNIGGLAQTPSKILSVERLGTQEVIGLSTSSKTFIADGFLSHNSTRYSVAIDECAVTGPGKWRLQADSNRQGSDGYLGITDGGALLSSEEARFHRDARAIYQERLDAGIAREQARKDLPLSNYTLAYWKVDLHNLFHFLRLRMDKHAQQEIREFATIAGDQILAKLFPLAWEAFVDYRLKAIQLSRLDIEVIQQMMILSRTHRTQDQLTNFKQAQPKEWAKLKKCRERVECFEKLQQLEIIRHGYTTT